MKAVNNKIWDKISNGLYYGIYFSFSDEVIAVISSGIPSKVSLFSPHIIDDEIRGLENK